MSRSLVEIPVMILCAGHGTRLRPLTAELPKPLVPLGDRPLIAHVVARLRERGAGHLALNTHHLPDRFASVLESLGIEVHVFYEPDILGTAGGVRGALSVLAPGPCVVHNGDILVDPPLRDLEGEARFGGIVFAVAPRPVGEGSVGVDADGNVVRLRGETFGVEARGGDYVGVCALGRDALAGLPEEGCLVGDFTLPGLRRGDLRARAVMVGGPWSDVGTIGGYLDENIAWLGRVVPPSGSFVGDGATVGAEVRLEQSVVGAGSIVDGSGPVTRSVIWPGARATAPIADAIVTTGGAIVHVASRQSTS